MKLTKKLKFQCHLYLFKPHHYSHRNRYPRDRGNGYLDMLIWSLWPEN